MIAALLFLQQTAISPVDALLEHVRDAVSLQRKAPTTQETLLTGTATFHGVPCAYTMRFQANGRFAQRMDGTLDGGFGYDGVKTWETDPSGVSQFTNGDDAEHAVTVPSLLSNRWLREGALQHAYLLKSDGDPKLLIQEWGNRLLETITIDAKTWLPKEASFATHDGPANVQFSNWKSAGQERLPFSIKLNDNGDMIDLNVVSASTPSAATDAYSIPSSSPNDFAYDASIAPEVESKTVRGHLFVHPLVNGKDVGWFILDTCAEVMMIDMKTADTLGLEKVGASAITGVGGTIVEPFRIAKEFQWGPAKEQNLVFCELDAEFLTKAFGLPVAGIVGADVFKRFIVEIDVVQPRVALYDVTKYQLTKGNWEPIHFFGGNPAVAGTYEGDRTGFFQLDTGANAGIMVNSPYVKGLHLLDGRKLGQDGVGGFGGNITSFSGTMDWIAFGGHRFDKVPASFSMAEQGALANPDVVGVVGQQVMTPFNMVWDFGHYRVALQSVRQEPSLAQKQLTRSQIK